MLLPNQQVTAEPLMTLEEYIKSEWYAERRREVVNGRLIPMPEAPDVHNTVTCNVAYCLKDQLPPKQDHLYLLDVKINVPGTTDFYYPDLFITAEADTENNEYYKSYPELIAEVLAHSTYKIKTVDKYIAYTSIPSLKYYLLVEPETVYVVVHSKTGDGKWEAMTYTRITDVIPLPLLNFELPLCEVYPQ